MDDTRRHSRRRRTSASRSPVLSIGFWVMLVSVPGMSFLYAGTQFWASVPFFFLSFVSIGLLSIHSLLPNARGNDPVSLPSWTVPALLCLLYLLCRTLLFPVVPYQQWTEVYQITLGLLFYVMFTNLGKTRNSWSRTVLFLFAVGCCQAAYAFWLHRHGYNDVLWLSRPSSYGSRASGTWICPNHFAHFLQMILICATGTFVTPRVPLYVRIIAGYTVAMLLPAIVLSQSRAGLLGTVVGVGGLVFLRICRKGWVKSVGVALALLISTGMLLVGVRSFYRPFYDRLVEGLTSDIRYDQFWPDTWNMIVGEGLWGVGPGVFRHVFDAYREHFSISSLYLHYAHNEYLHLIADYGWIPVLLGLGCIGYWVVRKLTVVFKEQEDSLAMIPAIQVCVLGASLAHAVFDFNLHITANAMTLLMILGLLEGQGIQKGLWNRPELKGKPRNVYHVSLILLIGILSFFSLTLFMSSMAEYKLDKARKDSDQLRQHTHASSMRFWTPSHWRGWTELGFEKRSEAFLMRNAEKRSQLITESRQAYDTSLRMNPYNRIALMGLVELSKMENEHKKALEDLNRLIELSPFDVHIRIRKGLVLEELQRYREALDVFLEAKRMRRGRDEQIELNIRYLKGKVKSRPDGDD